MLLDRAEDSSTATLAVPLDAVVPLSNTGTDTVSEVWPITSGWTLTENPPGAEKLTVAVESNPEPVIVSRSNGLAVVSLSEVIWADAAVEVTTKEVDPLTEPEAALIVVVPAAIAVANPALLT
jgi:PHD/YefM family antitoxin component YafN of YafNO toxin-antitoxin module